MPRLGQKSQAGSFSSRPEACPLSPQPSAVPSARPEMPVCATLCETPT